MKKINLVIFGLFTSFLVGCDSTKETLGFARNSPDEYTAIERPPLSMPPSYHLNAPSSAQSWQHNGQKSQRQQAANIFLGGEEGTTATSHLRGGEHAMLELADAKDATSDVRQKIDEETSHLIKKDKRFMDKLLFWTKGEEPASVVDPVLEKKRIDVNKAFDKPINEGTSKPIENHKKGPLEGLL